ncbi:MAG: transporter [Candidatus Riflebacteria bacterium]|nr:transporter [Candidatus Riflebacteria bacterium]
MRVYKFLKQRVYVYFILAIFTVVPLSVFAGRPFATEDAEVMEKGAWGLESGIDLSKSVSNDRSYVFCYAPQYGISKTMKIALAVPYIRVDPDADREKQGVGDFEVALKTVIHPEKKRTAAFLVKTTYKYNSGSYENGLGGGNRETGLSMVVTKHNGKYVWHGEYGYTLVKNQQGADSDNFFQYGVAMEYVMKPRLTLVSEVFGERRPGDFGNFRAHQITPLAGLTYQLTHKIVLDMSYRVNLIKETRQEDILGIGFTADL